MIDIGNVLISGGASGLGAATSTAVAKAGGTPLVLDMAVPDAEHAYRLVDIADSSAVAEATAELAGSVGGRLDGVFTAAGIDCFTASERDILHGIILGMATARD